MVHSRPCIVDPRIGARIVIGGSRAAPRNTRPLASVRYRSSRPDSLVSTRSVTTTTAAVIAVAAAAAAAAAVVAAVAAIDTPLRRDVPTDKLLA